MIDFAEMIYSYKNKCKKIHFDIQKIKDLNEIYGRYQIPYDEEIVAYIKSNMFFITLKYEGVILTNKAIYCLQSSGNLSQILFSEICKYLVFIKDKRAELELYSQAGRQVIVSFTLIAENHAGIELYNILQTMQCRLLEEEYKTRDDYEKVICWLIEEAENDMKKGEIKKDLILLMDSVVDFSNYKERVIDVKIENTYRLFDMDKYLILKKEFNINENREWQYQMRFINDLSVFDALFEDGFLSKVLNNIEKSGTDNENIALIKQYILIRQYNFECTKQVYSELGIDMANQLYMFCGKYYNYKMSKIYFALQNNTEIDVNVNMKDSIGLSMLHYAFILNKYDLVEELLNTYDWSNYKPPSMQDSNIMYDFLILAMIKKYNDLSMVFRNTFSDAKYIVDTKKTIEDKLSSYTKKLELKEKLIEWNKIKAAKARQAGNHEIWDEALERIEELNEEIEYFKESIEDLTAELNEMDEDLEILERHAICEAEAYLVKMKNSNLPYIQLLYKVYGDSDFLLNCIYSEKDIWILHEYAGYFFVLPKDVNFNYKDTDKNTYKQFNKALENKNEKIKKPYKDSWFSEAAHKNVKVLKKEYRNLVKRYHPDNNKGVVSRAIIQQIIYEKAVILNNLDD